MLVYYSLYTCCSMILMSMQDYRFHIDKTEKLESSRCMDGIFCSTVLDVEEHYRIGGILGVVNLVEVSLVSK